MRFGWVVLVAGVLSFVAIVGCVTAAGLEQMQRRECERLGHVYAPVNPAGGTELCWVLDSPAAAGGSPVGVGEGHHR